MFSLRKRFVIFIILVCFVTIITSMVFGQEIIEGELAQQLDEYLTRITPFGFSGAVLVADHDEIILNKGYGLADREHDIKNTAQTIFGLGTLTRQFTAAAILKLEMYGHLKTVDPIGKHLDNVPNDKKIITIHHLLTHTSGLVEKVGPDYDIATMDETVNKILGQPLAFFPGSQFAYSDVGYILLAAIIEKTSGQKYENFLNQYLFEPSEMEFTGYRLPRWSDRVVANWYVGDENNGIPLDKPYPYWNLIGNSGMLSSTGDMYKWYKSLGCCAVLDEKARKKLYTPVLENYSYGWKILDTPRGKLVQQTASNALGNSAEYNYYVDEGIFIIILCNQSFGEHSLAEIVNEKIEAITFGESVKVPPEVIRTDISDMKKFEGIFELYSGGVFFPRIENNALQIMAEGQDAVNVLTFPDNPELTKFDGVNKKATDIFTSALEGDFKPFAKELDNKEERLASVKEFVENRIKRYEDLTGTIKVVKSLGTIPVHNQPGVLETIVELHGEKGSIYFKLTWKDNKNVGVAACKSSVPVLVPFQMISRKDLVGYHLEYAKVINVVFNVEEGCSMLTFKLPDGRKIEAQRVKK